MGLSRMRRSSTSLLVWGTSAILRPTLLAAAQPLRNLARVDYFRTMAGGLFIGVALASAQVDDPHVIERQRVEATEPLNGTDFLLISRASKHPEIRGRDLSCYRIRNFRERGITTVAFLGKREPVHEITEGDHRVIIYPGPNPRCPSRSFEMDAHGRVARVIYERH